MNLELGIMSIKYLIHYSNFVIQRFLVTTAGVEPAT